MNEEAPDAPDEIVAPTPTAPGVGRLRLLVAVLASLAIGLAFVAAIQTSRVNDERREDAEVRRVAAAMGTALLTYDYTDLERSKRNVERLATKSFAKEYEEGFNGGYEELLKTAKATSRVEDIEVFISEIDDGEAAAFVSVDVVVSGTSSTNRRYTSSVRLGLVRRGERWLVNSVANMDLAQPADETPATTAPPPTTAGR